MTRRPRHHAKTGILLLVLQVVCLHYNIFMFHFHSTFIQWKCFLLSTSHNFCIWLVHTENTSRPQCDNVGYIAQRLSNGRSKMCLHFFQSAFFSPLFLSSLFLCSSNENAFPSFVLYLYLCWLKIWLVCVRLSAGWLFITLMVFQPYFSLFVLITQRGQALLPTLPTFSRNQMSRFQVYLHA